MIKIFDFFTESECDEILEYYDKAKFEAGKMKFNGKDISTDDKNTLMMSFSSSYYQKCLEIFREAFNRNDNLNLVTSAVKYTLPNFLRYDPGMYYRYHIDNYVMSDVYTDYSCTIFLNDPDEYDGGELVIKVGDLDQSIKLKRGKLLVYDTGLYHEVKDVISGSRKCLVFWMESAFRDGEVRKLYENFSHIFIKYEDIMETNSSLKRDLFSIQQQISRNYGTRIRKNS